MLCLAFVHNLLRRHPACLVLIDQPVNPEAGSSSGEDPYLEAESDPASSRAIESSLWEIETLTNHFYPQVLHRQPKAFIIWQFLWNEEGRQDHANI